MLYGRMDKPALGQEEREKAKKHYICIHTSDESFSYDHQLWQL